MVAELVPKSEIAADVGTDHGYLSVWLLQSGRAARVLASDIHEGPLNRARQTAAEFDLEAQMETYLCDGLQFSGSEQAQTIIIAGMGGETMISILSAAPWTKQGRTLILQPQSKRTELEQWLCGNGYALKDAKLCRDTGKLYLALSVQGGEAGTYRDAESLLLRNRDPLLPDALTSEIQKLTHAMRGMEQAERDLTEACKWTQHRLELLRSYQKEVAAW